MAVKAKRIKCARCGERETVTRGERGPVSISSRIIPSFVSARYSWKVRDEAIAAGIAVPSIVDAALSHAPVSPSTVTCAATRQSASRPRCAPRRTVSVGGSPGSARPIDTIWTQSGLTPGFRARP